MENKCLPPKSALEHALEPETRTRKPLFPFLDLKAEYATMKDETLAAVEGVLESQQVHHGPRGREI
jgi:hypothetical protein